MSMTRVVCPECKRGIDLDSRLEIGDEVTCSHCETDWKVVSRAPLVLDWTDEAFASLGAGRLGLRYADASRVSMRQLWPMR